jgi:hypothetical protein
MMKPSMMSVLTIDMPEERRSSSTYKTRRMTLLSEVLIKSHRTTERKLKKKCHRSKVSRKTKRIRLRKSHQKHRKRSKLKGRSKRLLRDRDSKKKGRRNSGLRTILKRKLINMLSLLKRSTTYLLKSILDR